VVAPPETKVPRETKERANVALKPTPRSSYASLRKTYRIPELQSHHILYQGDFSRRPGDEVLVLDPGRELTLFTPRGKLATLSIRTAQGIRPDAIDIPTFQIIDPVRDGLLEIQILAAAKLETDRQRIDLVVIKCIGSSFAQIFRQPIAVASQDTLDVVATVDFVEGDSHAKIRYSPRHRSGDDRKESSRLYHWNRWEGMFRLPRPAPAFKRTNAEASQSAVTPGPN
jgi:hypothetical protein